MRLATGPEARISENAKTARFPAFPPKGGFGLSLPGGCEIVCPRGFCGAGLRVLLDETCSYCLHSRFARLRGPCLAGRGLACSVPCSGPIECRFMRSWLVVLTAPSGGSPLRGIGIYRNFDMLRYSIYYTMENACFSEWLDRFSSYLRMRNYSPRTIEKYTQTVRRFARYAWLRQNSDSGEV